MAVTRSRRHTERAFAKARFRCPRCRYTSTMLLDISARGRAPGDILTGGKTVAAEARHEALKRLPARMVELAGLAICPRCDHVATGRLVRVGFLDLARAFLRLPGVGDVALEVLLPVVLLLFAAYVVLWQTVNWHWIWGFPLLVVLIAGGLSAARGFALARNHIYDERSGAWRSRSGRIPDRQTVSSRLLLDFVDDPKGGKAYQDLLFRTSPDQLLLDEIDGP
jgi:hypothetical protein